MLGFKANGPSYGNDWVVNNTWGIPGINGLPHPVISMMLNEVTAPNAGIALQFQCEHRWPGVGEFDRLVGAVESMNAAVKDLVR